MAATKSSSQPGGETVEEFLTGTGWGPSLLLILGVGVLFGLVWIAVHSDRFKQMVREEEGLEEDEPPETGAPG